MSNDLSKFDYFPSSVFQIQKPEFLESVNKVSDEYLEKIKESKELDEIYPVIMTENFFNDERIREFAQYIGDTAWNILQSQGYEMSNRMTYFTDMWTQEHHKHSLMEQHVHGFGSQLIGFYFLEVPENSSKVLLHDPRTGKVQINLPEADQNMATFSSSIINFVPKEGMFLFTNSWLPHSFGRQANEKPLKFVHFNIAVSEVENRTCTTSNAEVI